jgi:hypothetical protein
MKTAEFPAVEQARKVVVKQAMFYKTMMRDEDVLTDVSSRRKTQAAKSAYKPKKTSPAKVACTA